MKKVFIVIGIADETSEILAVLATEQEAQNTIEEYEESNSERESNFEPGDIFEDDEFIYEDFRIEEWEIGEKKSI